MSDSNHSRLTRMPRAVCTTMKPTVIKVSSARMLPGGRPRTARWGGALRSSWAGGRLRLTATVERVVMLGDGRVRGGGLLLLLAALLIQQRRALMQDAIEFL